MGDATENTKRWYSGYPYLTGSATDQRKEHIRSLDERRPCLLLRCGRNNHSSVIFPAHSHWSESRPCTFVDKRWLNAAELVGDLVGSAVCTSWISPYGALVLPSDPDVDPCLKFYFLVHSFGSAVRSHLRIPLSINKLPSSVSPAQQMAYMD